MLCFIERTRELSVFQTEPISRRPLNDRTRAWAFVMLKLLGIDTSHIYASLYADVMARSAHDKGNTFGVASWGTWPHTHHDLRVMIAKARR